MTEKEWLECKTPWQMMDFLATRSNGRKLRLVAIACARRVSNLITDPRQRDAFRAAERYVEGELTADQLNEAVQAALPMWQALPPANTTNWDIPHYLTGAAFHMGSSGAAQFAVGYIASAAAGQFGHEKSEPFLTARDREDIAQVEIIRDIFGDPFRPFAFDSEWLAGPARHTVQLAQVAYHEERVESLAHLATALENAGCGDQTVLAHCRGPGSHVRGCWVLDALLGHEHVRTGMLTDADWQACVDPAPMLHYLRHKGSVRKWRRFAVQCCLRIEHLITDERSKHAVEVASRHADGRATDEELAQARIGAQTAQGEAKRAEYNAEAAANFCLTPEYAVFCRHHCAACAACSATYPDPRVTDAELGTYEADFWNPSREFAVWAIRYDQVVKLEVALGAERFAKTRAAMDEAEFAEWKVQCNLIRELFSEYFGPVGADGEWLPNGFLRKTEIVHQAVQWCRLPTRVNE